MLKRLPFAALPALATVLVAVPTGGTGAQSRLTPMEVVRIVYEDWEYRPPFAAGLQALFDADSARTEANLDFDWISGGNDEPDMLEVEFTEVAPAAIRVTFTNRGAPRARLFEFGREGGGWVIDDVVLEVPEETRLSRVLAGQ